MQKPAADNDISVVLFNASTIMVGICLTAIGILYLNPHQQKIVSIGDFLITTVTMLFLFSGIVSYISLRNRKRHRNYVLERAAETSFMVGMGITALICLLLEFMIF